MSMTNAQHDTIMRSYERTRRLHRQELEDRREEVYLRIPRLREIDLLIPEQGYAASQALLAGEADALSVLKAQYAQNAEEKKKLLRESGFPADYLLPVYTCADCHDTGYRGNTRCHCYAQKAHDLLFSSSDLPSLLATNNFDVMREHYYEGEDLARFRKAYAQCMRFIDGFGTQEGFMNLLFFGPVGCGKSFLSIATAGCLLEKSVFVRYESAVALFEALSAETFDRNPDVPRGSIMRDLIACDLLIIDDLGTELTNAFVSTQLFHLINERYLKRRATIISTNFDLSELRARYSDRVFSRLGHYYTICELGGPDIRLQQAMER